MNDKILKEKENTWRKECGEKLNSVELLEEFKGNSVKIKMRCTKCGHIFKLSPYDFKRRKNNICKHCVALHRRNKQEDFEKNVLSKNKFAKNFILGKYVNKRTRVDVECKVCGHKWSPYPCTLYQGSNCPVCNRGRLKTHEQFCDELFSINKDILVIEKYIDDSTKILVKCKKCGHEWKAKPNSLLNGRGCSKCRIKHLERIIEYNLQDGEFQKTFSWLKTSKNSHLMLDFYFPKYNVAIECQGVQHFKPTDFAGKGVEWAEENFKKNIYRDKLKNELCQQNGIKVIYFTSNDVIGDVDVKDEKFCHLYDNIFTDVEQLKKYIHEKE